MTSRPTEKRVAGGTPVIADWFVPYISIEMSKCRCKGSVDARCVSAL